MFAQKASGNINSLSWVSRFLDGMLIAILLIYAGISIPGFTNINKAVTCHSLTFLITEAINCGITLMFIGIGV